jgi:hypothetical protein
MINIVEKILVFENKFRYKAQRVAKITEKNSKIFRRGEKLKL